MSSEEAPFSVLSLPIFLLSASRPPVEAPGGPNGREQKGGVDRTTHRCPHTPAKSSFCAKLLAASFFYGTWNYFNIKQSLQISPSFLPREQVPHRNIDVPKCGLLNQKFCWKSLFLMDKPDVYLEWNWFPQLGSAAKFPQLRLIGKYMGVTSLRTAQTHWIVSNP